ncbi:hypothetical protein D8674_004035 [Pyrus ussuriensis x Pyrus communis]|uniref:Uncharacterized protein n=1 Tax=Pyrus ussuriensis x Pyrus communis TaxID=2448454 RepID=A0A5N5FNZ0_9ROSA|nr:hypothetical protein D8674_004035 [Pyrus ussuriensis x Pyrus communis]
MENINKDDNVTDANPNDLMHHFQFAHLIVVAIGNNCHTAKWHSWKDVPENVKKAVMDELLCKYTLDDEPKELLMEDALEGGYNRWHYNVLQKGGYNRWHYNVLQ